VAAIADVGYHESTIADIVRRARVSREAFYRNFSGKLECFEAAIEMGQSIVLPRIAAAADSVRDGGLETVLRAIVVEYLSISASEPEFSIAWAVELATAGKGTSALRDRYLDLLAELIREAHITHEAPATEASEPRPLEYYVALVGGCNELICRRIRAGSTDDLPDLEEPLVSFLAQGLRGVHARPPRGHCHVNRNV